MKKLALSVVVAGVFLAGCGDNLPKEITSHENYKNCQEVEKNLLTIQSSFEKDERVEFYIKCVDNKILNRDGVNGEIIKNFKDEKGDKTNSVSLKELSRKFELFVSAKAQITGRDNTKYFSK